MCVSLSLSLFLGRSRPHSTFVYHTREEPYGYARVCVCVFDSTPTLCVFAGHVCYVTNEEERKRTRGPHLSCVGVWPMSDACHMTSMPHALASGLARSSLTLWGLSYILLCGGNSIDLRYTPPAFFGDTVTTRSDLFRSGDHLISATRLLLSLVTPSPQGDLFRSGDHLTSVTRLLLSLMWL